MKERMNIATALNNQYVRYACVMLTSLFQNNPDAEMHVYLLHRSLTKESQMHLLALAEKWNQNLYFLMINTDIFPNEFPTASWPMESYFRLALLDILPQDVDRLLYLDVDIIVNKPIKEMYLTDFKDALFCVCRDGFEIEGGTEVSNEIFKEIAKDESFTYFNAGMMLWNVAMLRENYNFQIYMELARKLDFKLQAPDQDLLNYMHWKQVKFLNEYRYDCFARLAYGMGVRYEEAKEAISIIHFVGPKPWQGGDYVHYDLEQIWWDYAKLTPFYIELMEEYLHDSICNPFINDTITDLLRTKKQLTEELDKSVSLCQRLVSIIERGEA